MTIPFCASPEMVMGCTELFEASTAQLATDPQALFVTCEELALLSSTTSNCWNVAGTTSVPVASSGSEQSRELLPRRSICAGFELRFGVRSTHPVSVGSAEALVLARTSATVKKIWLYGPCGRPHVESAVRVTLTCAEPVDRTGG